MKEEIEKKLIEQNPQLKCPSPMSLANRKSNVEVLMQIPVDGMSEEQFENLLKAEAYLKKAGVTFDTGLGSGNRDWQLDWSLKGAYLRKVREIE